jgi:hypothetical protein
LTHDLEKRQLKAVPERPPEMPGAGAPPDDMPPGDMPPEDDAPEDVEIRPDGTPGSLAAYAPKVPEEEYVEQIPAIMRALATRPKPWRMVKVPGVLVEPTARGPLDLRERIFTGDALARFASARFDPDAPVEKLTFDDDDALVELELISTGGDKAAEEKRAAMVAVNPEGKPAVTYRYGRTTLPKKPPEEE